MLEQRTPEWYEAKRGKVGSSMIHCVLAKGKGNQEATTRRNYRIQLACERLTGVVKETYQSRAMLDGKELEPMAKVTYEAETGSTVEPTFFQDHPTIAGLGASGDGLVGDDGMVEIKCPIAATHLELLMSGKIDRQYQYQMTVEMMCYGRQWCDFVSYNENVPESLQFERIRYYLEPDKVSEVSMEVIKFLGEVDELVKQMQSMMEERSNAK